MKRGDVVFTALPSPDPENPSHVQAGSRPAIVIQTDSNTQKLKTVTVVPLTGRLKARRFPHAQQIAPSILNQLDTQSVALIHQVTTLDQRAVVRVIGELDAVDMDRIDQALREFLGLA